jgi:two-component system, LytTR family, response regulator LytT
MTLRALVVEDEWPARNYLVKLLQRTGSAEVVAAVSSVAAAQQALDPVSGALIDVAFVDVQLRANGGDLSGLEWVRAMSRTPNAPLFVLATAFKQHAPEAFDLAVSDYLVKPFTQRRVTECVERLLARRPVSVATEPPPLRIAARSPTAIVFLDLNEVWACEAADRLTFVHSARGRFDLDLTLSAIGASFGRSLARVHRNWLVNASRVLELERAGGDVTLWVGLASSGQRTGLRVPVAKERATAVREALLASARGVRP